LIASGATHPYVFIYLLRTLQSNNNDDGCQWRDSRRGHFLHLIDPRRRGQEAAEGHRQAIAQGKDTENASHQLFSLENKSNIIGKCKLTLFLLGFRGVRLCLPLRPRHPRQSHLRLRQRGKKVLCNAR
jgi:hypothetical protein